MELRWCRTTVIYYTWACYFKNFFFCKYFSCPPDPVLLFFFILVNPLSFVTKLGLATVTRYMRTPLYVCVHTDRRVPDNRPPLRTCLLTLTAGARARRSRCLRQWSSGRRRSLPGEWPWLAPPSYYCSVCPECCRTAADWSLCPVRPSWAQICPGCGDHPWAPC